MKITEEVGVWMVDTVKFWAIDPALICIREALPMGPDLIDLPEVMEVEDAIAGAVHGMVAASR